MRTRMHASPKIGGLTAGLMIHAALATLSTVTIPIFSATVGSPYAIEPLSVCFVTLAYCGQTVGWIKTPLGTELGLGQGDTVLDEDRGPPRKRAQQPPTSAALRTQEPLSV